MTTTNYVLYKIMSFFRNCLRARQIQYRVLVPHPSGAPPLSPPLHQEIPAQAQSTQGCWKWNDSTYCDFGLNIQN